MKFIGNILWLILVGLIVALYYFLVGLVFCVTIIGIPFGLQLMKMGVFALWPFGSEIKSGPNDGGCLSVIMNIIWIFVGGIEIASIHAFFGLLCCITIVGIPFGMQHFKMTLLALVPFGKQIE
jgi:uncharacterized membrane protein YccF (DUF307 family)